MNKPSGGVPGAALLATMAAAAAMAVSSLVAVPGPAGLLGAGLALVVVAIARIDATRYIIPDELTIAAVLLGLAHAGVLAPSGAWAAAIGLALARGLFLAGAFFLLREAYFRLRGREGLGLGDVKLAGAAGAWLAFDFIPVAIEIAALSAIAVHLMRQAVLRRPTHATARLPFGLYLAPAIWATWLTEALLGTM